MALPRYREPGRTDRRRKPPEVKKTWQVGEIWDRHHRIKRLIFLGFNNQEVALRCGCTPQTVSNVRNSKIVKDQLTVMHATADAKTTDIAKEIKEFAPVALELLKNVVNGKGAGKDATIALRAKEANNFVDRAGFGAPKTILSENVHAHFTSDELKEIKERAMKTAKDNGNVVDAEYEEVGK